MRVFPFAASLLLTLAGCAPDDFSRPGTWQPSGVNEANLRAMVAEPRHLRHGVAAPTERALPAVQAIRRLDADRRRPLPDSRTTQVGGTGGGNTGAPGPAPEAGSVGNAQ